MTTSFIDRSSGMLEFVVGGPLGQRSLVFNQKGDAMRKILVALATIATLAFSASAPAHAQRYLGAAIFGGLVGGAIVGSAVAASPYYYGPGYYATGYYGPGPYYGPRPYPYAAAPGPYYGGPAYVAAADPYGCYWQRQRFWDGYAWRIRRARVCG
jgi:hypothetical protein